MSITSDFRPQTWDDIVGQDHVVSTLVNSLISNRTTGASLPNAFLFVGIRGTGKTTTARVLAKTLNCHFLSGANPCNECPSCLAIMRGSSFDVKEIDMATNRGIDDVRALQEAVQYAASGGKFRVIIMDEAHQMTNQAASALLKILEEPPRNVIFILATTEINKILPTIRSRCQVHSFKRISEDLVVNRLSSIYYTLSEKEPTEEQVEVFKTIARTSDGSMRDSESKLSNLIGLNDVSLIAFKQVFGAGGKETLALLLQLCDNKDKGGILREFSRIESDITEPVSWALELASLIFDRISKGSPDLDRDLKYLDVIESYVSSNFTNQPAVFLKLMLLRMAQ
jgi:DNA polymerase III subunit gamma/tau